jgi:hypothetical protein
MAWRYECIENHTADTLAAWLSQNGETHPYALIDVQRLSIEQIEMIDRHQWGTAVNLYADLDGTAISAMGPRLVQLPREEIPNVVQLAWTSRSVSFLLGPCDLSTLSAHLQAIREVAIHDRTAVLFRYQDIHVTAALFPILPSAEIGLCLGPLTHWAALDACNRLHVISATGQQRKRGTLRFDQKTVETLDDSLFVHAAMAQVNDTDSLLLASYSECEAQTVIRQRIDKAKSFGLEQREDLALYCILSLQFPQGFEKEAPFAEAMDYRANNKLSFGAMLDEVPPDVWSLWDERLKDKEQ